jgi:hypothetical protein
LELGAGGWSVADISRNLALRAHIEGEGLVLRNIDMDAVAAGHTPAAAPASAFGRFSAGVFVEQRQVRIENAVLHGEDADFQVSGSVGFDLATDLEVVPARSGPDAGRGPLSAFRLTGSLDAPRARELPPARRSAGLR